MTIPVKIIMTTASTQRQWSLFILTNFNFKLFILSVSGKPFGVTINKMSLAVFSGQALSVICSYS